MSEEMPASEVTPGVHFVPVFPVTSIVAHLTAAQSPDRQPHVILRLETPTGMTLVPFDPEHARKVAARLMDAADDSEGGLVVPPGGLITP